MVIFMKGHVKSNFLRSDFRRALESVELYIGIAGMLLVLLFGCMDELNENSNVIHLVWYSCFGAQFLFVMIFGAVPYACALCEDIEYGYLQQEILRGNLTDYCLSKVVATLTTAIFSYVTAMMIFVGILRIKHPWIAEKDSVCTAAIKRGSFHMLLEGNHYYLYFLLFAFQMGLLIGILALISLYVSLFIANKLLILSIPVIAYYFLSQSFIKAFPDNYYVNLDYIFGGTKNVFGNDICSFLYACLLFTVAVIIMLRFIYSKLERRIVSE